jgi:hypothetical protein
MDKNRCCIVIPSYKEKLDGDDKTSFERCVTVFSKNRPIKVIVPDNISTEFYDEYGSSITIVKVKPENMESINAYSKMLCSKFFWELFTDYEYVLIYQTDCWVFEDRLDEFMDLGYDYYGAAWPHLSDRIGNGGFSLRKVDKMLELTTKYEFEKPLNEDLWFCDVHKKEINICGLETACNFSIEVPTARYLKMIKTVPVGLHGKLMKKYWNHQELLK